MAEQELSKAEYLQRYLSGPSQPEAAQERRRRKKKPPRGAGRAGIRIVDDDISLNSIAAVEEKEEEEDDGDLPVVAEFIDERPDVVKFMEAFRRNTKWKLLGDWNRDSQSSDVSGPANSTVRQHRHDTPSPPRQHRHDTPSPPRQHRHDTPSPPRQQRHDTPSPPRQQRHDTPESSPPKTPWFALLDNSPPRRQRHDTPEPSPPRASSHLKRQATPDLSPPRKKTYSSNLDSSPPWWKKSESPSLKKQSRTKGGSWNTSDADRRPGCVRSSSLGKQVHSQSSDSDLSPPRRSLPAGKDERRSRSPLHHCDAKRCPKKANVMFSGVKAGLVSADVLRREQQELQRNERNNKHLEEESRHAETVFRDKSGRKRDLAQERLEQRQKAKAQSERDEQYAKWGKGLVQERQQQQNVEDAIKEMQKPLARYIDDQDLDRMLRAQEREGDPMAALIKKRKAKENKEKEKPRYQGPAPLPNRFNIWPGHRWDGVDRSNGFEQQRFARIANKKAVQELAYKWSIEDM